MLTINDAMRNRHSVRSYETKEIPNAIQKQLLERIDQSNRESGLHIQLVTNEPKAFDGMMAHYGKFNGVTNYIALIGKKGPDLEEKCGYYGEDLVLFLQQLGLNTCWVAISFSRIKSAYVINPGEKLCLVISLGYGISPGVPHKSKTIEALSNVNGQAPEWFIHGMEAAILAPTAINQQKFKILLTGKVVSAIAGSAFYSKVDLGIVKYHFEIGAGKNNFEWKY
ncbi:nitroreductase family protein [Eubacteriaceae bacterium ES2]|nr:nitroreductase family protein [Eubacteriaceae bacterium ES2]